MDKAKRFLLLVTQSDWGGVQAFLIRFAERLMREGHTVLLAAGGDGELWQEARKSGIPSRQLRYMRREISPLADMRAIREIKQLIQEFEPDAIHLNSSKMSILGSLAAAHCSLLTAHLPRVVYRIGGWVFLEPLPSWKKRLYLFAEQWSAKFKDIIITVHPGDEALAKKLNIRPRKDVRTVPNGLDTVEFASHLLPRAGARTKLGLPEHAFVIGTIANAYPTKALLPYLDSLQRILESDHGIRAVILGDGPEFDALKQIRRERGLEERVLLPGHINNAATLLPAFDLFVLPSRKEGMPWTLLESMTAGIPCIATDVGACRWMLTDPESGDAGIIVPPNDAIALEEAVRSLRNDPERRERLASAGRRIVQARFSWDATYRGNRNALLGI